MNPVLHMKRNFVGTKGLCRMSAVKIRRDENDFCRTQPC